MPEVNKVSIDSKDIVIDKIDKLKMLFPEVITEGNGTIDFEKLKLALGEEVNEDNERYCFTWPGKREAIKLSQQTTDLTLKPSVEQSVNWDTTNNSYIEGDNLEVLRLLQRSYHGRIKMIYIDPPYNTGNDFVYKDKFESSIDDYKEQAGLKGHSNSDTTGRLHSDWCSMIFPRLKLSRELLSDDGVIFISIDDNEYDNLKKICDEIFGESNRIETFNLQVRYASKSLNEKDNFQKLIEQVLIYAKNKQSFVPNKPYKDYDLTKFCWSVTELGQGEKLNLGGKDVVVFKPGEYEIKEIPYSIDGLKPTWASGSVLKGNTSGKFFDKQLSQRVAIDGYGCMYKVYGIGEDGIGYRYFTGPKKAPATKGIFYSGVPLIRREQIKTGECKKYSPIINFYDYSADFGNISHEGDMVFRGGKKPVKMLKHFIEISNLKDGDIVLDYFSGSASTAHAVMQYNSENNSNIKYIMVQLPQALEDGSDSKVEGFNTICEIGEERIRRAGNKIVNEVESQSKQLSLDKQLNVTPDIGFRVFRLDESNFIKPTEGQLIINLLKEGVKDLDIICELIIKWGLPLSSKIETIQIKDYECYSINNNELICCMQEGLNNDILNEIADMLPDKVFILDNVLTDSVKLNALQIFKNKKSSTQKEIDLRTI